MSTIKAPPGSLLKQTRTLLKRSKRENQLETVAHKTKIPYLWLNKIADGRVKNPSVNRIQKVYEHLSGSKLC